MSSIQQLQSMYDNLETEFNRIKNETKKPENHPIQKILHKQITQYNSVMMSILRIIKTKNDVDVKIMSL